MAAIKRIVSGVFASAAFVAAGLTLAIAPAQAEPIAGQCGPVGGVSLWNADCTFTLKSEAEDFVNRYVGSCQGQGGTVQQRTVSGSGQRWNGHVTCGR